MTMLVGLGWLVAQLVSKGGKHGAVDGPCIVEEHTDYFLNEESIGFAQRW